MIPIHRVSILLIALLTSASASQARDIVVVAHRGANHLAPENTMTAAMKCVELGVDYVEIDVRTSQDGVFYILHDKTLDPTTNGTGAIAERDSSYIDDLDAGSWFGTEFEGERVPRLAPFLKALKGKIKIYFESSRNYFIIQTTNRAQKNSTRSLPTSFRTIVRIFLIMY